MKKVIATIAISSLMALCLAGCGSSDASSSSSSSSSASSEAAVASDAASSAADATTDANVPASIATGTTAVGDTYKGFLDEYTYRMELETPILIDEFNSQSASLGNNAQARAELRDEKIAELEKICNEGIGKMDELRLQNSGTDSEYEEYVAMLQDAYQAQADVIRNA